MVIQVVDAHCNSLLPHGPAAGEVQNKSHNVSEPFLCLMRLSDPRSDDGSLQIHQAPRTIRGVQAVTHFLLPVAL